MGRRRACRSLSRRAPPYVAVLPFRRDAELRLTTFDTEQISAAEWVGMCAEVNRPKGRPVVPVRFGVFSGWATEFASPAITADATPDFAAGQWIRGWALHAGPFPLDATYRCPIALARRDDTALEAMLRTLYLRGLPA